MLQLLSKYYSLISAVMAFVVWGGWAFYVNDVLQLKQRLVTAFAQGTFSLVMTLLILGGITSIYHKLPENFFRIIAPAILVTVITGSVLVSIHLFIGTPEILITVSPGLTMTFLYCILTALKLKHA